MSVYQTLAECEQYGKPVAVCTVVETSGSIPRHAGSKMLVFPDGTTRGTIGGGEMESRVIREALEALQEGRTRLLTYSYVDPQQGDPGICGGTMQVYVEPVQPGPTLVVVGGGHVGRAVAHLAKWLGFRVAVSDDRPEYCTPEMHPDADAFYPVPLAELPGKLAIHAQTYLVLTTRGMPIDLPGVPALLETPAAYIGIIGSKRRWVLTRKALAAAGVAEEKLARIHSPMGLELGAETPEEIAVSIMAEILMLRNRGSGASMQA